MRVRLFALFVLPFCLATFLLHSCGCSKGPECVNNQDCITKGLQICFQGQCQSDTTDGGNNANCLTPGKTEECYSGAPNTKSVGVCRAGNRTCGQDGQWSTCQGEVLPGVDICDGKDNDCDGVTDKDCCIPGDTRPCFPQGKIGCTTAADGKITCTGACKPGTQKCTGGWGDCLGFAEPKIELCDNKIDDDCDGNVDNPEKLGKSCTDSNLPDKCQNGIIACDANTKAQYCKPNGAKVEECNGQDDDCDGKVDNVRATNDPLTKECTYTGPAGTKGVGLCRASQQSCTNGKWSGQCDQQITPQPEICNGKDDDCDGKVDNRTGSPQPLTQPCYRGPADTRGKGECKDGVQACVDGKWIECAGDTLPQDERYCTGSTESKDFDCDGTPNNFPHMGKPCLDRDPDPKRRRKGICRAGKFECYQGFVICRQQVTEKTEECNGKDDDCDGFIDNGTKSANTPLTKSCYSGSILTHQKGICKPGTATCDQGSWGVCVGELTPRAELCNGQDDNCNGLVDEGASCAPCTAGQSRPCYTGPQEKAGQGICKIGTEQCGNGQWSGQCAGAIMPTPETCNGQDDDCDGKIDNKLNSLYALTSPCYTAPKETLNKGDCRNGIQLCTSGKWDTKCMAEQRPEPEICDGRDNNCDGNIDEKGICGVQTPREVQAQCSPLGTDPAYKRCKTGLLCIQAREDDYTHYCYQPCNANTDCTSNKDGRTECTSLGKDEKTGQEVKVCVRRADEGGYCDFAKGYFCKGGLFCDAGLRICRSPSQAGKFAPCGGSTGNVCDPQHLCVTDIVSGQPHGYCLQKCINGSSCASGLCSPVNGKPTDLACLPLGNKKPDETCGGPQTANTNFNPNNYCQKDSICAHFVANNPLGVCWPWKPALQCTQGLCKNGRACLVYRNLIATCPIGCTVGDTASCKSDQVCTQILTNINVCLAKFPIGKVPFASLCSPGNYCKEGLTCFTTNATKQTGYCTKMQCTKDSECPQSPPGATCRKINNDTSACVFPCTTNNQCPGGTVCDPVYRICLSP